MYSPYAHVPEKLKRKIDNIIKFDNEQRKKKKFHPDIEKDYKTLLTTNIC